MQSSFDQMLPSLVADIARNYEAEEIFFTKPGLCFPSRSVIIEIIDKLRRLVFPGYFGPETLLGSNPSYYVGNALTVLKDKLYSQVYSALCYDAGTNCASTSPCNQNPCMQERTEKICEVFLSQSPVIQTTLLRDVQAAFDGDPAAQSKEEVIFSYPGLLAIFVYRFAHVLYQEKVPFIPRIMTEYAHSQTGIDINAGATIGEYFFMDHGTGIVIGETTIIGDHVKLYQGVTLGALSTRMGQQLSGVKRHPTIEDNVTIYSNASVLGGETVIGHDSVIGGSAFITESIAPNTRVSVKNPELTLKTPKTQQPEPWNWEI